jgi:hypothetical protein
VAVTTDGPNTRFRHMVIRGTSMPDVIRQMEERVREHDRVLSADTTFDGHSARPYSMALLIEKPKAVAVTPSYPSPEEVAAQVAANFTSEAVIERVARAINRSDSEWLGRAPRLSSEDDWQTLAPTSQEKYRVQARHVINEMLSGLVADAIRKDMS